LPDYAMLLYIFNGQTIGNIIRREALGGMISKMTHIVTDLIGNGKQDVVCMVCSENGTINLLYNVV
jgi:hypothetical protein